MEKQVSKDNYNFGTYCHHDRWASYHHQLREIIELKPKSMLEVGAGDYAVSDYLVRNFSISYTSVDIAEDLGPDAVGSVDSLPFKNDSYDVVVAFEVLEHLPFEKFEKCLSELARVSKSHVIISIPHFGPPVMLSFKIPFLKLFRFAFKIPYPKKHVFNGQHYWEVGKRGFSRRHVRNIMEKNFVISKEYVPFENQYHRFYVLRKR